MVMWGAAAIVAYDSSVSLGLRAKRPLGSSARHLVPGAPREHAGYVESAQGREPTAPGHSRTDAVFPGNIRVGSATSPEFNLQRTEPRREWREWVHRVQWAAIMWVCREFKSPGCDSAAYGSETCSNNSGSSGRRSEPNGKLPNLLQCIRCCHIILMLTSAPDTCDRLREFHHRQAITRVDEDCCLANNDSPKW